MGLRRRTLLGALAAAGLAGCGEGSEPAAGDRNLALWCWPGGLDDEVVRDAVRHFAPGAKLTVSTIEGDYLSKLTGVLSGAGAPAIAGIKGEDIASVLPRADLFVDLNTLGALNLQGQYLDWKWRQGSSLDNRLVGFPIDIGPTALFYREDQFRKAGLASEPDDVAKAIPDWDRYLAFGRQLRKKLPAACLIANGGDLFASCRLSTRGFVSESNQYIGDSDHILAGWDLAVEAIGAGISAGLPNEDDRRYPAYDSGKVVSDTGPAWLAADLIQKAPTSAGKWRVANGAADGSNVGGSFLGIPARSTDHEKAFEVIRWLLSPENQARMFAGAALFPSAPAAYQMPELLSPEPYFGGQRTSEVFAASAQKARLSFEAPADAAIEAVFIAELVKVETGGKNAKTAWSDAVAGGRKVAQTRGVIVG